MPTSDTSSALQQLPWELSYDVPCTLGESPFWHPREQRLYWVDIAGKRVHRLEPASGAHEMWQLAQEPGCIAPAATGGLVLALRDGIYRARGWQGTLQRLVGFPRNDGTIRFNDGKADPVGRFWAGTIYEPRDARKAELYSFDCRPRPGQGGAPVVQLKAINATVANGLAWSPDQRTVYWTDTAQATIFAWDWDATSNVMRHHRVFHRFAPKPAGWKPGDGGYAGRPDGAAMDVEGHYWAALFEGQRLARIAPSGEVVAEYEVPVRCPTMPCFGGPDGRTLYLTTSREKRPAEELAQFPRSGCVFAARVDVAGVPVHFFQD